jgi:hypothetical protein
LVCKPMALFWAIGSANNHAHHFTKALPLPAHCTHCCQLMGLRFLIALHAAAVGWALTNVTTWHISIYLHLQPAIVYSHGFQPFLWGERCYVWSV